MERIAAAAALADEVCARIPGLLREGMSEAAFAGKVEAEARALGHQGVIRMRAFNGEMFYGQLLTGASGAVPSFLDTPLAGIGLSAAVAQGVSFKPIRRGEPVVFDFVPVLDGYTADFTRIFVARRAARPAPGGLRVRAAGAGGRGRLRPPGRRLPRGLRGRARRSARRRPRALHGPGARPGALRRPRRGPRARRAAGAVAQRHAAGRGHGVRPRAQVRLRRPRGDRHREHLGGERRGVERLTRASEEIVFIYVRCARSGPRRLRSSGRRPPLS